MFEKKVDPTTAEYLKGLNPEKLSKIANQIDDLGQDIVPRDRNEAREALEAEIDRRVRESLDEYRPPKVEGSAQGSSGVVDTKSPDSEQVPASGND